MHNMYNETEYVSKISDGIIPMTIGLEVLSTYSDTTYTAAF